VLEEMKDVEEMINHLELIKSLNSENLPEILEALDKKYSDVGL
jgi:lipopolysaccharide biosynthesis regulator YciM